MYKTITAVALTFAAAVAVPATATATTGADARLCKPAVHTEQYQEKVIRIAERCQTTPGWVRRSVFINGRELGVMKLATEEPSYISVVNSYEEMPTLLVTARRAVETLGPDNELEPFEP
ncbi:hypothetical protein FHS29_005178 [Saccharothrix tamanrassetensis]|uniref:Uncharacterized protein n=1 Tax=Saccharothrix tamanrassetensis TaxID=1051531 RepID=A0A841CN61_9PSEU|nr:tyrosinase family oxidase copper chaperone [Saccharothrix tamanrassetensis]MBB5958570.1 hypothetical protein [Saccharothrix tamanrassetensis]